MTFKGAKSMNIRNALISGAAGATSLTLLHETARQFVPHAPRVDVLGIRAIAASLRAVDQTPPSRNSLYWLAMLGDLTSNSLYYSLVGLGDRNHIWRRGFALGAAAGLGTVVAPRLVGLGRQPGQHTPETQIMTFLWYLAGGLAASAVASALDGADRG
jgi:hypothetical protein